MRPINGLVQGTLVCVGTILSMVATAGSATGTITQVQGLASGTGGPFFVYLSVVESGGPTCATQTSRFAINSTTDIGKTQIAIILAAKAAGTPINILGSNICTVWADTEDVEYVVG